MPGAVQELDARAVQGGADGHEHPAQWQADHDLAAGRGRHVDGRKLDDQAMLGLIEQHGGRRQRAEARACESDEQRNQE